MEFMTLSQALTIFGLKSNYTEEDLKKQYRKLIKQNHPDYHMKSTQEEQEKYTKKAQEINEAYDILKKNLNKLTTTNIHEIKKTQKKQKNNQTNVYNYQTNEASLSKEKIKAINEIKSYYMDCNAKKLVERVEKLVTKYIKKIITSSNINITIINFKIDLELLYRDYILLYSKKHNIPSFIIKNKEFNFDCNCAKLFEQIKDCEKIISQDISKIIRKHQFHEHFKILEKQIIEESNILKEKITFDTKKEEYLKLLEEYDEKINKLIIEYSLKYRDFKYALDKLSHQLDNEVKSILYKQIKIIVLKSTEDELLEILKDALKESSSKKNMQSSKDKNISTKKIESEIRETIYKELRQKYLNNSKSFINLDIINKLYIISLEMLFNKKCTVQIATEINKITFENPKEEYERIMKLRLIFFGQEEFEKSNNGKSK